MPSEEQHYYEIHDKSILRNLKKNKRIRRVY